MLWVAVAALAGWVLTIIVGAELVRSIVRSGARERDLLVNQVCNLAGRPWQAPPSIEVPPSPEGLGFNEDAEFDDVEQLA